MTNRQYQDLTSLECLASPVRFLFTGTGSKLLHEIMVILSSCAYLEIQNYIRRLARFDNRDYSKVLLRSQG